MTDAAKPTYRSLFQHPGTGLFFLATCIGRLPPAMKSIGCVLLFQQLTGLYTLAGLVGAVQTLVSAFAAPQLGRWVDRYGERMVLIWSTIAHVIGGVSLIAAAYGEWPTPLTLAAAAILGGSTMPFSSLSRARWSSVLPKGRQLDKAYAMESMADELGFVLGPIIVVPLSVSVHPAAGLIASMAMTVIATITLVGMRTVSTVRHHVDAEHHAGPSVATLPVMRVILASYVFMGVLFGAVDIVLVAFAEEQGHKSAASFMAAAYALGSLLGAVGYGARQWHGPVERRMVIAFWWMGLGAIPMYFAPAIPWMTAAVFITGLAISPGLIAANMVVEEKTPRRTLTEAFAWLGSAMGAGAAIGAFAAGWAVDHIGVDGGQLIAVSCGIFSALIIMLGRSVFASPSTAAADVHA